MAIIESLSVTAGGGVVSSEYQSKQKDDVVNIFIGLGGVGTDAIRCIKKQVNERILPDNADAYDDPGSNLYAREYKNIKFLSVDTDHRAYCKDDLDVLESAEKIDLSFQGYFGGIIDTTSRPDLKWINTKNEAISQVIARGNGAGAIRQAGRYLFYDKIDFFEAKISQLVKETIVGFTGNCKVVVHVYSSFSGGTGSGIFLDVCYAVRKALSGIANKMIVGYFFMPDIIQSIFIRLGINGSFIMKNAYAALQELNYCMGLPDNGGSFRQIVNDGTYIDWNCPPVNCCCFISARNENLAYVTDDAYDFAMRTVTEYAIDFLSNSGGNSFDIYLTYCHGVKICESTTSRTRGYNPCMVSLGAACASISYREINTYLVSGVFEEYRKNHKENVTQAEAEDAINTAWNVAGLPLNSMLDKIYSSLLKKLSGNESSGLQLYDYYQDPDGLGKPWGFLLDTVNSDGANDLEAFYQNTLYSHLGSLARNADKLTNTGDERAINKESLIFLLDQVLDPIVKDIGRGPQYAKNIIDHVEGANVLNLIAGLKARNNAEYQNVEKDRIRRYEDYLETKRIFFKREKQGLFDDDKKRYHEFEKSVRAYVQLIEQVGGVFSTSPYAKPLVGIYEQISNILNTLEKQIKERIKTYYAPLADVLSDLTCTFEENYKELKNVPGETQSVGFNKPLVSVHDENIIAFLNERILEIPMTETFSGFMGTLIEAGYDAWQKREGKLPKIVESFFFGAGGVFRNCSGINADSLLEKKYGLTGPELEQRIIDEYVSNLMNISDPLLPIDDSKLDGQMFYRKNISFQYTSSVITHALNCQQLNNGNWRRSPLLISDRILCLQLRDGFPLQAYAEIGKIEDNYIYSSRYYDGTHLYEENGIYEDIPYSDWSTLPSITLPSVMGENIPEALKSKRDAVKQLFDKAIEYGVIKLIDSNEDASYDYSKEMNYSYIYDVPETLQEEINGFTDRFFDKLFRKNTISEVIVKLEAIQNRVYELLSSGFKELTRTDILLKQRSYRDDIVEYDTVLKFDFLYASPVYQIKVREIIEKIDANRKVLQDVDNRIKQLMERAREIEARWE